MKSLEWLQAMINTTLEERNFVQITDPIGVDSPDEEVVGTLSDELKAFRSVMEEFTTDFNSRRETMTLHEVKRENLRFKLMSNLFWWLVCEEFDIYKASSAGIRVGFQVVQWDRNEPDLQEMVNTLLSSRRN